MIGEHCILGFNNETNVLFMEDEGPYENQSDAIKKAKELSKEYPDQDLTFYVTRTVASIKSVVTTEVQIGRE